MQLINSKYLDMNTKAGFSLATPTVQGIKTANTIFSLCGAAGGSVFTGADLQAILVAEGLASPNGAAAPTLTGVRFTTAPKGRLTLDQATDADIVATGEKVDVNEDGNIDYVHGGEDWYKDECITDSDCDLIPDTPFNPATEFTIPEGSCAKFRLTYA